MTKPSCLARKPKGKGQRVYCTLPKGHSGKHIAEMESGEKIEWRNEDEAK